MPAVHINEQTEEEGREEEREGMEGGVTHDISHVADFKFFYNNLFLPSLKRDYTAVLQSLNTEC